MTLPPSATQMPAPSRFQVTAVEGTTGSGAVSSVIRTLKVIPESSSPSALSIRACTVALRVTLSSRLSKAVITPSNTRPV